MKLLFLLLSTFVYLHAIITVVPQELGAKAGVSGKVEASLQTKRGNTDKDEYSGGIELKYDNNSTYLLWANLTGSYGKASGQTNTNKTYAHLRLVHSLYEKLEWEGYLQSQSNKFTNIQRRRLGGLGLRFGSLHKEYGKIFTGVGAYYEQIAYTTSNDASEKNARVNFYLAYVKKFSKKNKFAYVAYYQPKFSDFHDYISSQALVLEIHIYQELYINFKLYYDVDTEPAIGIKEVDFTQKTAFVYKF